MSRDVGNVRNQEATLTQEVKLDKAGKQVDTKSGSSKVMDSWLGKGKNKTKKEGEGPDEKKAKK